MKGLSEMKAALYIRLVRGPGGDAATDAQKSILTDLAQREDMEITEIYQDIGFSGRNFNRPSLQTLLKDSKEGRMDAVFVKDLSRLGRDVVGTWNLVKELRAYGVQVRTPNGADSEDFFRLA